MLDVIYFAETENVSRIIGRGGGRDLVESAPPFSVRRILFLGAASTASVRVLHACNF